MRTNKHSFQSLSRLSPEARRRIRSELRDKLNNEIKAEQQLMGEILYLQNEIEKYKPDRSSIEADHGAGDNG